MTPQDETARVTINRRELLRFFDEIPPGSCGHATSIVSIAGEDLGAGLLKHCLETRGACVKVLQEPCTPGQQKGARLDRWVYVTWTDGSETLFQVEIKNWSAHAIGGRRLALDVSQEDIRTYKRHRWTTIWEDGMGITHKALQKVIEPMAPPASGIKREPMACLWAALHPDGQDECLFTRPLPFDEHFERLWFFSMSAYLRSLDTDALEIEMPNAVQRRRWLDKLFDPVA